MYTIHRGSPGLVFSIVYNHDSETATVHCSRSQATRIMCSWFAGTLLLTAPIVPLKEKFDVAGIGALPILLIASADQKFKGQVRPLGDSPHLREHQSLRYGTSAHLKRDKNSFIRRWGLGRVNREVGNWKYS